MHHNTCAIFFGNVIHASRISDDSWVEMPRDWGMIERACILWPHKYPFFRFSNVSVRAFKLACHLCMRHELQIKCKWPIDHRPSIHTKNPSICCVHCIWTVGSWHLGTRKGDKDNISMTWALKKDHGNVAQLTSRWATLQMLPLYYCKLLGFFINSAVANATFVWS